MNAIVPLPAPFSDDGSIREALARLCDSSVFQGSPRLRAFLRYIVETTLAGNAASIKAYTIAVGALGRPESFDPMSDAIVRVEAGRLRTALARYYEDADDALMISLPRGTYVPRFDWREGSDSMVAACKNEAKAVYEARRAHQAVFRSSFEQMRGHVAELRAALAASGLAMARSEILIERSRRTARQDGAEEPSPSP